MSSLNRDKAAVHYYLQKSRLLLTPKDEFKFRRKQATIPDDLFSCLRGRGPSVMVNAMGQKRSAESFVLPNLPSDMLPLHEYDEVHVNVSGGADSIATTLVAVHGYKIPKEKIKLVHMRVDGNPNDPNKRQLFDWPQTDGYLEYMSKKLDLPLIVLWDDFSLEERIRERGMFPSSTCRFCTSYLKRDVYAKWVRQFDNIKVLLLTGERSEESNERAEKPVFKFHSTHATGRKNRTVHWLKPIKEMLKTEVRQLCADYGIELHPCYQWVSRCSCKFCIFNTSAEMSRTSQLFPDDWAYLKQMEEELGHTMKSKAGLPHSLSSFIQENQISLFC